MEYAVFQTSSTERGRRFIKHRQIKQSALTRRNHSANIYLWPPANVEADFNVIGVERDADNEEKQQKYHYNNWTRNKVVVLNRIKLFFEVILFNIAFYLQTLLFTIGQEDRKRYLNENVEGWC